MRSSRTIRYRPITAAAMLSAALLSERARAAPPLYTLPPRYDHVVLVILENVNPEEIIGSPAAPYMNSLAAGGVTFDSLSAFKHTSAPNYGELFAGHHNGIVDGAIPPGVPFTTPNLGAELRQSGFSFAGYAQSLPAPGSTVLASGSYVRGHNPWVDWQNDAADAHANQLPSSTNLPFNGWFPADFSTLPTVALVVPDNAHNMHDGTTPQRITTADDWIGNNLGAYAAWAAQNNSLLIITADEDARNLNNNLNKVPTIFFGAGLNGGAAVQQSYTLHNILRTLEDMYGTSHAQAAGYVRPIAGAFAGDPELFHATLTDAIDTHLRRDQPDLASGSAATLTVDASGGAPTVQALVRFEDAVGDGAGQIPPDATVLSAKLTLWTGGSGSSVSPVEVHRLLIDWDEGATWNQLAGGIDADGVEARALEDFRIAPAVNAHPVFLDVSDSVQAWLDGTENHGWAILPTGDDAWDFVSAENAAAGQRPALEVTYALYPRWSPTISSSWDHAANWKHGMADGPGMIARFGALPEPSEVRLGGDRTIGTLLIDSPAAYRFVADAEGRLMLANRGNVAAIDVRRGSHAIEAPVEFIDPGTIYIQTGAGIELSGGVMVAPGRTLAKSGAGEAAISGGLALGAGSSLEVAGGRLRVNRISGGGTLSIGPGATVALTGSAADASRIAGLELAGSIGAWEGSLDLGQSAIEIDYPGASPLPIVLDQIRSARESGWSGGGIGSSAAAAAPEGGIGYRDSAGPGDGGTLLLRFALWGDANLDGEVSFADLVALAQHYNSAEGSALWSEGDFNYDRKVTFEDLVLLSQNYNSSQMEIPAGAAAGLAADLAADLAAAAQAPEPGAAGCAAGAVVLALVRRRRRGG